MFLKKLRIEHHGKVVRDIVFKDGLNLVLDETPSSPGASGNNVGKTTMLKVVDFCLGGKIEKIYKDKETKSDNIEVKKFLEDKGTIISLTIGNDKVSHTITRQHEEDPLIDNESVSLAEFERRVGYFLFKLTNNKPSLRQVSGKFIRLESYQIDNVLKFMHSSTSKAEYEFTFLHLFGFKNHELLREKANYINNIKKEKKIKYGLSHQNKGTLKQKIKALESDLKKLEQKSLNFEVSDSIKSEINNLETIRASISSLSLEAGKINTQLNLSKSTLDNLERAKSSVDSESIEEVYNQAGVFLSEVKKSFDEVVSFHNSMIENKIKFVKSSLFNMETKKEALDTQIGKLASQETKLLKSISKKGALEDLNKLNNDIGFIREEKGKVEGLLIELEKSEIRLKLYQDSLDRVTESLKEFQERLEGYVSKFNEYFRDYSKELYGEEYILSADLNNKEEFDFEISAMHGGAVGSGKKKGQVAAFDLAYLKFLESKDADTCRFQLNDRQEEMHFNTLKKTFEIANSIKGQYVISILKERISMLGEEFIEKNQIIKLSQNEKFFKL